MLWQLKIASSTSDKVYAPVITYNDEKPCMINVL